MNLPINDVRNLSVGLLDPTSGKWYNPATDALEPFDATTHLKAAAPVAVQTAAPATGSTAPAPPAGLFAGLRCVDVGSALMARPNLVPVWFVMDSAGTPQSVTDVWPNPFPASWPVAAGGWAR